MRGRPFVIRLDFLRIFPRREYKTEGRGGYGGGNRRGGYDSGDRGESTNGARFRKS